MSDFVEWVDNHKPLVIGGAVIGAVAIFYVVKKFGSSSTSNATSATAQYQPIGSYAGNYGGGGFDAGAIYGQLENSIISAQNQNTLFGTALSNSLNSLQQSWNNLSDQVSTLGKTTYTSSPSPPITSSGPGGSSGSGGSVSTYLPLANVTASNGTPSQLYQFTGGAVQNAGSISPANVAPGSVFYSGPSGGYTIG